MEISLHECIYIFPIHGPPHPSAPALQLEHHLLSHGQTLAVKQLIDGVNSIPQKNKIIIGQTGGVNLHSGPAEPNNKKMETKTKKLFEKV